MAAFSLGQARSIDASVDGSPQRPIGQHGQSDA